jgi:dienelactone hydrolase
VQPAPFRLIPCGLFTAGPDFGRPQHRQNPGKIKGMTRRMVIGLLSAAGVRAQAIHYREYARCLPDYLATLADAAYARRNARIAALRTAGHIRGYQAWARTTFKQLIGGLPPRTPLNLRVVGAFDRPRYRVEKLVYETRPGLVVPANLYLPKEGRPPYPGVLFQMGHSNNGKSYSNYQRCCQGLVQLGYVVLAFDPMGQGERTAYPIPNGWLTRLPSSDDEHTMPGHQMLLVGETATALQLWDAIRSLDVLAAHPQVDPKRLGATGQSGGGTLTMMLVSADDRVAVAAVCSGNTENFATRPFLPPGSTDDAEQNFIGSGPLGFDRWDLLWPFAPKPLLIAISARDFFGTYSPSYEASGREEFQKLARAYELMGARDRLLSVETPLPHGLSYSLRLAVYDWFERHLQQTGRTISEEPPTAPEPDPVLWCGPTGNTKRDFGARTPYERVREAASAIRTPSGLPDLKALLRMPPALAPARLSICGHTRYANCEVQAVEVNTEANVWVPAWLFLPKQKWTRLLLAVEPNGRNARWHEEDLYASLAGSGIAVCAVDIRGIGDLDPQYGPGAAAYAQSHHKEESYAWASLILGTTLLGQRTADVLRMAQALAAEYPNALLTVAGRGRTTIPVLCAAALEPRIARVYLADHLVSWRALLDSESYSHPFADFIPNVLRFTDLPQIARSIAPRVVVVAGAVDASGDPAPRSDVPYAEYREQPAWDRAALSTF